MNAKRMIEEAERKREGANITRFYNVVVPTKNGEARIDLYAVKTASKRKNTLAIEKVVRYYTDRRKFDISGRLYCHYIAGYKVDWADYSFDRCHSWYMKNPEWLGKLRKFSKFDYKFGGAFMPMGGIYLNDFKGTKYEHCGYLADDLTPRVYMHFLEYAECWNISHATEFLVKSKGNLRHFIRPRFITRLKENKDGLFQFFRNNIKPLTDDWFGIADVNRALSSGCSLEDAKGYNEIVKEFRGLGLPSFIDKVRLHKYLAKKQITTGQYGHYLSSIKDLGKTEKMRSNGVAFPKDFAKADIEAHDECVAKWEREHAEEAKARREREAAEAKKRELRLTNLPRVAAIIASAVTEDCEAEIIVPTKPIQFVDEGNMMGNCIGSFDYDEKMACADTACFFMRLNGKPYDVEIDLTDFKVLQCYGRNAEFGSDFEKKPLEIAERFAANVKVAFADKKNKRIIKEIREAA